MILSILLLLLAGAYGREDPNLIYPEINIFSQNLFSDNDPLPNVSETCAKHLNDSLNGVLTGEQWALQMLDSITKSVDGFLMGNLFIPGHFDECTRVVTKEFKGKHCMLNVIFKKVKENLRGRSYREGLRLRYGICVPSTCNSTDIINVVKLLERIEVTLQEKDCSTDEFRPLRTEDWLTISFLIILLIIAIASTVYDVWQRFLKKIDVPNKLLSSFSFYTNAVQLFQISQNSSQLKCLHGIRFLSMCWVILGHTYFTYILGAPINLFEVSTFMKDKSFIPVSNAFVAVDTFFFMSGLLACLVFFRDISKKGSFDAPVAFIHRYFRLTPPFAILILIQATIISRIGNGPFWNSNIDQIEKGCRHSWWTAITYIQNYVNGDDMCLGQSWYLSADMQMYLVSPLILYPIYWWPGFAPIIITLLVLASAFTSFAIGFQNKLNASFGLALGPNTLNQFRLEYSPFHTRMAPYLIGLATGYIICGLQAKKIQLNFSKIWIAVGWLVSSALCLGSVFSIARFIDYEYTNVESSFYLAFHRVGWALGLAWIVIACVGGYGGPVNYLLSLDCIQPLAKMSYCNFLIHMSLQQYRLYTSRTNQYLRHFEIVYAFFGDLVISHILSIPVVLLFEFPFVHIERYFFQNLAILPISKPNFILRRINKEFK